MSPHYAVAQKDHMRLEWYAPTAGADRVRAMAWTCDCRATIYELLHAGGRAFIRKTIQSEPKPKIAETYRWPVKDAKAVWDRLLRGEAR
ncbi:hypothetical protein [Herbidospora sp. NBRC 101105]|uniref:hypothetical protein n=1 Tax=Herbidospora sp. NBRC 101105 TaxID=3032195 RepID=UPI002556C558|nr:hypothetical protein [Herbidospora sp. NBRC 101105]